MCCNNMRRGVRGVFLCATLATMSPLPEAQATVLTFETAAGGILASGDFAAYGDNVTTSPQGGYSYGLAGGPTPNVTLNFTAPTGNFFGWAGSYGDLVNVAYWAPNPGEIVLTAGAGYQVQLSSFDMAGWPNTDRLVNSVSVLDGSNNVLFSQTNFTVEGNGVGPPHSTFLFSTALEAPVLKIRMDSGGSFTNVAVDNVQFSQVAVPEPSAVSFGVLSGLILLPLIRRQHFAPGALRVRVPA